MKQFRHIAYFLLILLLLGGVANKVWAQTEVTYHILALPMNHETGTKNTNASYDGFRVEAVKVVAQSSTIVLPDHFKSPLAKNFTYYAADFVTKGSVVAIYPNQSGAKYQLYTAPVAPYIKVTKSGGSVTEEACTETAWTAHSDGSQNTATNATDYSTKKGALADGTHYFKMTTLNEGGPIGTNKEIYVTYEYDPDNTIAKLDGSVAYNISMFTGTDASKKGFLALNRGRNNRLTIVPASKVSSSDLISDDFVKIDVSDTDMKTYWQSGDNWNDKNVVGSNFHFLFKYIGEDPYNITICTAYDKDTYYIEKFANDFGQVNKYYKGSTVYYAPTTSNPELFITSDVDVKYKTVSTDKKNPVSGVTWDDKLGWYRQLAAPIWNSFAILDVKYIDPSKTGHVFLATRTHNANGTFNGPTKSGSNYQYNYIQAERNAMKIVAQTPSTAVSKYTVDDEIYDLEDVNFKVVTPFGNTITASSKLSKYTIEHDEIDVDFIPSELDRKYINYTGKFYKDAALENEITSYLDAYDEETEKYNVYVEYEVSNTIQFKAIKPTDSYTTATWYELTDFESDQSSEKKLKWDGTYTVFKNNGGNEVYDKLSEFAFVGDPYELRVLYRSATEDNSAKRYVGAASLTDGTTLGFSEIAGDGYKWEIPFGENIDRFVLRLFGSGDTTPMYWKWDATSSGNNVTLDDDTEPTRIKVMELPKFTYTYNVVDLAGNIAIKGTAEQPIFTPLSNDYLSIPTNIRSPFLSGETVTFYNTFSAGTCSDEAHETPVSAADIYVKYTKTALASKSIKLNNTQQFNVKLNGEYIYYNSTDNKILSSSTIPSTDDVNYYLWRLEGSDPYAIKIYNVGKKQYVTGTWTDNTSLSFEANIDYASRFIAMMSNTIGIYEVLAASGNTEYYHIGRPTAISAETKVFSTATYVHGADQLRFELSGQEPILYTLIDKAGEELLDVTSNNPRLALPAEYVSPLVETYYYFPTKAKAISALTANKKNPTSVDAITEPDQDTNEGDTTPGDNHIWVTYKVNNLVKFNDDNSPYLLKFKNGGSYKMEDGNDKLTSTPIKAMYPYTNGDGNLNIYGEIMNNEQMNGGSNTRSRWTWFFDSDNDDPYHVTIHSKNKITYDGVQHPTYLQTYAVHFNQDTGENAKKQRVVTGGALPGIASTKPTEYMILGTEGNYKLLTTNKVPVDLDGDDNTTGDGENVRQYVNSFEQYWKTYNMVKLHVLRIDKSTDKFDNDESTWVVPADKRAELNTKLGDLGIGSGAWHSYDAIANATRWNGYNDKSDGHDKKVVEKLEHWYQTFDMGDGFFEIESADIPPVLVLLDRHGWEIMRKPLPKYDSYPYGDELEALKVYDSPMVKEYKFYNNASKASGCHKYTLRMQNGAERDQIKHNGKHYTSSSLAVLPPRAATGAIIEGVVQDLYVTYTVKEEYENSYKYHLELHEEDSTYTESGTPSKFLILQNGRYFRKVENDDKETSYLSKPIIEATEPTGGNVYDMILSPSTTGYPQGYLAPDNDGNGIIDDLHLWYIQPNLNIDKEMGIKWAKVAGGAGEPFTEYETKKEYKGKTGFDPYNIQLKNVQTSKYLTTRIYTTALSNGGMVGDKTSGTGSKNITLQNWVDVKGRDTELPRVVDTKIVDEGYDHTNLQVTNQTFMAVSDANGNMQLMPRFDHSTRIEVDASSHNTTLENPKDHAKASVDNNSSMGPQTTFFVRPQVIEYHILDNNGQEALRYKRAGEYRPSITEHFRSPLATDFKYYFDHAASTTYASNRESYTVAVTPGYFQKSVASKSEMTTAANALTVLDDYYFKITTTNYNYVKVTVSTAHVGETDAVYTVTPCTESDYDSSTGGTKVNDPVADDDVLETAAKALATIGIYYYKTGPLYDYKKVTVTKAHSGTTNATYTTTECKQADWENAAASQRSAADEAAMQTAILSLAKGTYYYQLGSEYYAYKKVVRADGKNTITISNSSEYTGTLTADDEADFEEKAKTLSINGTYYYKVGPLYNYQKVVVSGSNATLSADIAAGKDISDRQITGTFADADLTGMTNNVYVRYSYDASSDDLGILQGKWLTINLAGKDVKCGDSDAINTATGTGVSLLQGTDKPTPTVDGSEGNRKWQWKFLAAPIDPSSELHESPDPYAIQLFNRQANYCEDMREPNPMRIPIKVNGKDCFTLLSHPDGGYALAVNGLGTYSYDFLNGTSMDEDDPATTTNEAGFTVKTSTISADAQLLMNDDVTHTYTYYVINNAKKQAVSGTQTNAEAAENSFAPTLPYGIQSPLLNMTDYKYYGSADIAGDTYTVVDRTKLFTLYGLYDDNVYVRYNAYSEDNTEYAVPNKRNASGGTTIAVADDAKFTPFNISGRLPYNIIWEDDKMMATQGTDVFSEGSKELSGATDHVWRFFGNDPYAIQIRHGDTGKYINGTATLSDTPTKTFMLLKREGYEYGVLQVTGDASSNKLTDYGESLTTSSPKYFIIFGLSTHKLIYHLVIAKTCPNKSAVPLPTDQYVDIPYSEKNEEGEWVSGKSPTDGYKLRIYGTTQRDLTNDNYQLGETILGQRYSYDAGEVSIGDALRVPTVFSRPNCVFFYYIDNIQTSGDGPTYHVNVADESEYNTKKGQSETYTVDGYYYFQIGGESPYIYKRVQVREKAALSDVDCTQDDYDNVWQDNATLNGNYQGLKVDKLMEDPALIGSVVNVNVAYAFQTGLETNAGEGFVTSVDQNLWYTFETQNVATPYLAHYTNAWGLQAMPGLKTRYTNDYLWTPLGDVYGFRMYNRYMIKNSGGVNNVMTTDDISEGQNLKMAESTSGREVYELLGSNEPGYFRIHPVINYTGTQYYIRKDPSDDYAKLSTNYSEWTFNLPLDLLKPYIERVGYVGGLTKDAYDDNKTVLDKVMNGTATYADLLTVQGIVYNDDNIVKYKPGYYRLHNQPDVSDIDPLRYASGYLHEIEKTAVSGGIPMHFYSKSGVTTKFAGEGSLESGYTISNATRGDIPIVPTEQDPSTIFYFNGAALTDDQIADHQIPTSKISTQGLYVAANPNGDNTAMGTTTNRLQRAVMSDNSANAITFSLMDIGGAVLLIHDGATPATRRYLNFDQSNFFQRTATDDTDYNSKKEALTSIGDYYFKIGSSTYKVVKVTRLDPYTSSEESSDETEWKNAADIYDLKYYHDSPTDDAKWCLQPVQKGNTAGAGEMPLTITTNNGGDNYYYATFCAPFDVLLPNNVTADPEKEITAKDYYAYVCDKWDEKNLHPTKIPASSPYTIGKFVPAGTPVIIRTSDESGSVKLALPSNGPTPSDPENLGCVFSGKYLEQMLTADEDHYVYTLGLPFTTPVTINHTTGAVTAELPEKAKNGLGFYINANPNKEHNASQSMWLRNNRYVLHNKIYYREGAASGASARGMTRSSVEFVPLIFDDLFEENQNGDMMPSQTSVGDGCVYDMQGRRVANAEQVLDGTWKQRVAPGIYIINGKKVSIR